jgi:ABC-2 type transport system permease protein
VTARATIATARRVGRQLLRDRRTLALLIAVPSVLLTILYFAFEGQTATFDRIATPLVGLIPFTTMFIVTSIAMLRERTSGTLERLMSMPVAKLDLLFGYAIAFGLAALVEVLVLSAVVFGLLDAPTAHPVAGIVAVAVLNALLGMALGLFVSAFARTEFQAVQFMPAVVLPQLLVCGLFVARDEMAGWLEAISWLLPLTYAYDALEELAEPGVLGVEFWVDVAVIVGATLLALALGAITLRRRTP